MGSPLSLLPHLPLTSLNLLSLHPHDSTLLSPLSPYSPLLPLPPLLPLTLSLLPLPPYSPQLPPYPHNMLINAPVPTLRPLILPPPIPPLPYPSHAVRTRQNGRGRSSCPGSQRNASRYVDCVCFR